MRCFPPWWEFAVYRSRVTCVWGRGGGAGCAGRATRLQPRHVRHPSTRDHHPICFWAERPWGNWKKLNVAAALRTPPHHLPPHSCTICMTDPHPSSGQDLAPKRYSLAITYTHTDKLRPLLAICLLSFTLKNWVGRTAFKVLCKAIRGVLVSVTEHPAGLTSGMTRDRRSRGR